MCQVLAVNEEGLRRCHEATVARGHPVTSVDNFELHLILLFIVTHACVLESLSLSSCVILIRIITYNNYKIVCSLLMTEVKFVFCVTLNN